MKIMSLHSVRYNFHAFVNDCFEYRLDIFAATQSKQSELSENQIIVRAQQSPCSQVITCLVMKIRFYQLIVYIPPWQKLSGYMPSTKSIRQTPITT